MLKEIFNQKQGAERRWFASEAADLYIWQDKKGGIEGFEYCYRIRAAEFSLRWRSESGFEHARVDDGEPSPFKNNTPVTLSFMAPNWGVVAKHFREHGKSLEEVLYNFILNKLYYRYCQD